MADGANNPHATPIALLPIDVDTLCERVAMRVAEILAAQPPIPALIDRRTLARELGVSQPTITRMLRAGMPHLVLGSVPRFELGRVIEWLRSRKASS